MELNEKIFEKAKQIAMEYPMPPDSITESDARAMMENASIQLVEWAVSEKSFVNYESFGNSETLNVRLELASNGAIFTDLDCEDKYLATEVFLNEREEDVAIYEELGGWLYTELEHRGLVGKNIELSIKVKEI